MKLALMVAALVVLFRPIADADECMDKAVAQADMNACAGKAYAAADAELNKLYRQIQERLKDDADTKQRLVAAQRAWAAFRDAECRFSSAAVEGGTVYPTIYGLCLGDLTNRRIDDFKSYLNCRDGDLSCPVPAGK
jgi:uncharacterized protein YecT (DUF1311 family)